MMRHIDWIVFFVAVAIVLFGHVFLLMKIRSLKKREKENKEILVQLKEAQKMESIGRLAGGVAHDFNNMLAGINGAAEMISVKIDKDSQLQTYTDIIIKACRRASVLTSQLLVFSRNKGTSCEVMDFHKCIDDAVMLLSHGISKKIIIRKDLSSRKHFVCGNYDMLQNMVLNLGVNARDAMPDGGFLVVRTKNVMLSDTKIQQMMHKVRAGSYIELVVKDTGTGIPDEIKNKIFEPFFTTKAVGRGSGLGLPAVYGIIVDQGGTIKVRSSRRGTSFYVYFPVDEGVVPEVKEIASIEPIKGRILIVDDEKILLGLLRDMLMYLGMDVVATSDVQEAIKMYEEDKSFDLVMLDVLMPEKTGVELYEDLKRINSDIKVVFMSGYNGDTKVDSLVHSDDRIGFVSKPYHMAEVSAKISKVLAKK